MSPTTDILEAIVQNANTILECTASHSLDKFGGSAPSTVIHGSFDIAQSSEHLFNFSSPQPLTAHFETLGIPHEMAENMSRAYLRKAEELKRSSEKILHSAFLKLTSIPPAGGSLPVEMLLRRLFDTHHQQYLATLTTWSNQAVDLFRLAASKRLNTFPETQSKMQASKSKRKFKTEYLPLFEYAFEKDRFPNREDKRYLAKISGMSYRQVCVWFQNRRCRYTNRVKSQHLTSPPQTFEEMKERLSVSAREALSGTPSALTAISHSPKHDPPGNPSEDVAGPLACDDEFENGDDMRHIHHISRSISHHQDLQRTVWEHGPSLPTEPVPKALNMLNPLRTPTASVFPAVYKPSKLTVNPFVVEPQSWLRRTQAPRSAQVINPTPGVLESLMEGFDKMEVDAPMSDSDSSFGSLTAHKDPVLLTSPHTNASALRTSSTSSTSFTSMPRTFSSSSSVSWSSDASTPASRSASYSTAPSSVLSSPNHSEICLPTQNECESAPSTLTTSSPSADEESTCTTRVDEVASTDGPFDLSSIKPASKARVDEWVSGVSTHQEDDHAADKWQQLLAAAAAEASPET